MPKGIIQISSLGKFGRFGNQLFQYAFARAYAEKNNCILQTPTWVGQKIFQIQDPPIGINLPLYTNNSLPPSNNRINIDLHGYFQNILCLNYMSKDWLKRTFVFRPEFVEMFKTDKVYYAAHLRRGDYKELSDIYCLIHEKAYKKACREHGFDLQKLEFISEENPSIDRRLKDPQLQFLPDFFRLLNSQALFRSNSTFSWWASTLGNMKTYSPIIKGRKGHCEDIKFIEGNWPMMFDPANNPGEDSVFTDLILKEKQ